MRIAIDLQACQSSSRNRGIGRLSWALTRSMAAIGKDHEFWLILSERFPDAIPSIRAECDGLIPLEHVLTFGAAPRRSMWSFLRPRPPTLAQERAELIARIDPDVLHVASAIEFGDTVAPVEGGGVPTAVTLYDLIPLIYPDRYFKTVGDGGRDYRKKLEALVRADLLLAISNSSRAEAIEHLNITADKIVTIDAGVDARFHKLPVKPAEEAALRARLRLDRPFIMYTGGIDWRKNIGGLVEAFALLPQPLRDGYRLAIVCEMEPEGAAEIRDQARKLGLAPQDIVLTGFVPDDDLVKLYNLCHLFIFPSLHEGFGLPLVEAMACGAPVIGSNTTSMPEIIGRADALFDPTRPSAIADAMTRALTDEAFRQSLRGHGPAQARLFTWESAARRALSALETLAATKSRKR